MSKIFAITNQKGGVGKTTTSVNLAASLSARKKKVLLIDLDPQGNATMGSGVDKNDVELSVYDMLVRQKSPLDILIHCKDSGFDILPANADLTAAEVEMLNIMMKEHRLRIALKQVSGDYDYILIDCPPSLNMLTVNALVAAQGVVIPMQCEYYALEGLSDLLQTVRQINSSVNPGLVVEGVVRTMYDPRNSLTNEVSSQLETYFGNALLKTTIPRNVRLAEAPSYGLPALYYDETSKGATSYLALADELIARHETVQNDQNGNGQSGLKVEENNG
ncbi:MAG: ParA family protein [Pseudomonadales bacterium]|nr:ParA family protein [Pseudomonadales bacterium]